jgi:hypothetical protein
MVRWTEEQLQQHKGKVTTNAKKYTTIKPIFSLQDEATIATPFFDDEHVINKVKEKRNVQHEEAIYEEFCLKFKTQLPNEWDYLYRVDPLPLRKLIARIVKALEKYSVACPMVNRMAGKAYAYLKRTGMKAGQFDYEFKKKWNHMTNNTIGLHIEFKHGKNKLTPEQETFKKQQESQGRKCVVCYSADEAIEAVKKYLRGEL